jgi:pimeloyl-ACP methyl ester carboxylesterase
MGERKERFGGRMNNPIVFIHGSGDSASIWRMQLEHFGPIRAYAIDLPGHGHRPDTLPEQASVLDYARAVREIITNELHLDHPIIAGHSLGGAIALMMALEYGSEPGGIILIGTGARLRVHPDLLESARTTPEQARVQLKELGVAPAHVGTISQALVNEQEPLGPNLLHRDLAACNVFDCMAQMNEIRLPALIICGAEDRLTPVKYSQYLHDHLEDSTLRIIADAGHYVMREQPEEVNRAIEEWLTSSPA